MKYRKKPVVIEAIQLNWKNWGKVCDFLGGIISSKSPAREVKDCSNSCGELSPYIEITIPTLEGDHIAKHGDYIIKGVKGEFYPCKPDIFEATYEKCDELDEFKFKYFTDEEMKMLNFICMNFGHSPTVQSISEKYKDKLNQFITKIIYNCIERGSENETSKNRNN